MLAIINSMKYQYSNGVVEASVNKIKLVKRIMHGRCSFDLLKSKTFHLNFYVQSTNIGKSHFYIDICKDHS
jgi:hypothetical protein